MGSLPKFEGEFKGALGSWHPLISSPGPIYNQNEKIVKLLIAFIGLYSYTAMVLMI